MSSQFEIVTYLCSEKVHAIDVASPSDNRNAISVSGDDLEVAAKMLPVAPASDCTKVVEAGVVETSLIGTSYLPVCNDLEKSLSITYVPDCAFFDYPVVSFYYPDECRCTDAYIMISGPSRLPGFGEAWAHTYPDPHGVIPIPNDKGAVFPGGASSSHSVTQNAIVPGMRVRMDFHYRINNKLMIREEGPEIHPPSRGQTGPQYWRVYWDSQEEEILTGGTIESVDGDDSTDSCTYTVDIEGDSVSGIKRSDWVEWDVGDWVFILKTAGVILPMKIGADGS